MFVDDLLEANRRGMGALTNDMALFGADWGFRVADVRVPVRWWRGDADSPGVAGRRRDDLRPASPTSSCRCGPGATSVEFAAADLVLETVASFLA